MERKIDVTNRRGLVHWTTDEGTYFVTFRLFDSLPQQIARERKRTVIEKQLDAGGGAAFLREPRIAQVVLATLERFHGERYFLHTQCVMPNHVHSVFRTAPGLSLSSILHSWKSFTAHEANRLLGRRGPFWEREWFDALIRDERDLQRANVYVLANPEKGQLRDWPWVRSYDTAWRVKYEYRGW